MIGWIIVIFLFTWPFHAAVPVTEILLQALPKEAPQLLGDRNTITQAVTVHIPNATHAERPTMTATVRNADTPISTRDRLGKTISDF